MALNFPNTPEIGDTHVEGGATWVWDGVAWNIQGAEQDAGDVWYRINGDTGTTIPNQSNDTLNILGGDNITTSVAGDNITISASLEAGIANAFATVTSDDGTANVQSDQTLNILGGTNIATNIATDTDLLLINMQPFSIDFLSDVDITSSPPATGNVLKWDGTKWAPGADATTGGGGTDADTLDGFDSAYFLDYNNFSNTPAVLTLSDISVGNELTASGDGAISYDDSTGVFRYTPPDLSVFLTSVPAQSFASLTGKPTTLAGYGITDAFDGAYSSLSGTPTIPTTLTDLGIADGDANQVLSTDGAGNFTFVDPGAGAGGGDPDQNLWATISADVGSTTANSITDTLTIAGGTNIDTQIVGDTLTVNFAGGTIPSNFTDLDDVPTGLSVNEIYLPAITMLEVTNSGTTAYLFDQYGGNNPTLYAISGTTIAFNLNVPGHPFLIQDGTGADYDTGLIHVSTTGTVSTGSAANGQTSGTLYWKVPFGISGNYRYQCSIHAIMVGAITVKSFNAI
jgi:plastocyanin